MGNVYVNSTQAVQQPLEVTYDPSTGWMTQVSYRGEQAYIESKELELRSYGWKTRVLTGPVWSLEASIAADARNNSGANGSVDPPVDTWEILGQAAEKDLLWSTLSAVASLGTTVTAFFRDVIEGKINASDWDFSTGKDPSSKWGSNATTTELFKCVLAGVKSVTVEYPVVRHTKTVSRSYEIPDALYKVGHVWTQAQLQLAGMPTFLANSIPAYSSSTRTDGVTVLKGYLKKHPQIMISAFSKSQIINEWTYGEWADVMYDTWS